MDMISPRTAPSSSVMEPRAKPISAPPVVSAGNPIPQTAIRAQWFHLSTPASSPVFVPFGQLEVVTLEAPDIKEDIELRIDIPIDCIAGVWTPSGDRAQMQKVTWQGKIMACPFFKAGLLAFVDRNLFNRLAIHALPDDTEVAIQWNIDQAGAAYRLRLRWTEQSPSVPAVRLSTVHHFVHDVIAEFVAAPDETSLSQSNYEPSYCTWYAFHGDMTQSRIRDVAVAAKQLGFGSFILDDGWQYDAPQRVGTTLGRWHRYHGDYHPSPRKFPDFDGLIEDIQNQDMQFVLWIAPFLIGEESKAFGNLNGSLLESWLHEGFKIGDPRSDKFADYICSSLRSLVTRYPIDGFKVDYDYALLGPGEVGYGLGKAYVSLVKRILTELHSIRPHVEWNLIPTTFATQAANAFRCIDVPFDPDTNRLIMANLHAVTGNRPLHYDPSVWSASEPAESVHRHMIPSVFCVPSVGVSLLDLPPQHHDIIRAWLRFYRQHQRVLNHGKFEPFWTAGDYQSFRSTLNGQQIAAAFSTLPVCAGQASEAWLINAAGPFIYLDLARSSSVEILNYDGIMQKPAFSAAAGIHRIDCPCGSIIHISR